MYTARVTASLVLLLLLNAPVTAQSRFTIAWRQGTALGSSQFVRTDIDRIAEISARIQLSRPWFLVGGYEGQTRDSGCDGSTFSQTWCGYGGDVLSFGGGAGVWNERVFGGLKLEIGRFDRDGRYLETEYPDSNHFAAAVGAEGGLRVIGPVGVQAAIVHRRIYDDAYERVFGAVPHYTTVVAGVSLGIGQPPPGFWF